MKYYKILYGFIILTMSLPKIKFTLIVYTFYFIILKILLIMSSCIWNLILSLIIGVVFSFFLNITFRYFLNFLMSKVYFFATSSLNQGIFKVIFTIYKITRVVNVYFDIRKYLRLNNILTNHNPQNIKITPSHFY